MRATAAGCAWMALAGALLLAAPAQAQPEEPADQPLTRPAEGLLFVGPAGNAPFSYLEGGKPAGFDVRVIEMLAEQAEVPITVRLLRDDPNGLSGAQRAIQAVEAGLADGLIGLGDDGEDEAFEDRWILFGPTHPMTYRIAVLHDDRDVTVLADLVGMRLAAVEGTALSDYFANNPRLGLIWVRDARTGCLYLNDQRVRGVLAVDDAIRFESRRLQGIDLRFLQDSVGYRLDDYGPAMPAGADARTVQTLREAMGQLRAAGAFEQLRAEMFGYELRQLQFYEQQWFDTLMIVLSAAVPLVVILVLWRRSIQLAVAGRTRKLRDEIELLRKQYIELEHRAAGDEPRKPHGDPVDLPPAQTQLRPIELGPWLTEQKDAIRQVAGSDVTLGFKISDDDATVMAHEPKLRSALLALCENAGRSLAKRAAEEKDFSARLGVLVRPAEGEDMPPDRQGKQDQFVALSVRDNGMGIDSSLHQKIFTPGYTTDDGAAGQGLARVYAAVGELGGWIDLSSAAKRGATFTLFLPKPPQA